MDIFKPTTLDWWQLGLLKWAVFVIGIAVGATWPELFAPYALHLFIIGLLVSGYLFAIWKRNK